MYCGNCGKELPDGSNYCVYCGAARGTAGGGTAAGKKRPKNRLLTIVVAAVVIFAAISLFGGTEDEKTNVVPEATETVETAPENGWYENGGSKYYFSNGEMLTGLQEIDGVLYCFYVDGPLAVNTQMEINGNTVETDSQGRVTGAVFANISGEWSSEKFKFGNNGKSSVMELSVEVENCDKMTFYLEAEGLRGANVNGTWKLYVRSNGSWVYVQDLQYTEPSARFTIRFDTPMDFDAITAYPTKQGNASYSTYYTLYDVHMGL